MSKIIVKEKLKDNITSDEADVSQGIVVYLDDGFYGMLIRTTGTFSSITYKIVTISGYISDTYCNTIEELLNQYPRYTFKQL